MGEFAVRLRFTQPSLGDARRKEGARTVFAMLRDGQGGVLYSPVWWQSLLTRAAKASSDRMQGLVKHISWDPVVVGHLGTWRRYLPQVVGQRRCWAEHEAFLVGSRLEVRCLLPVGMDVEALERLLTLGGRYYGISPYRDRQRQYGTFTVETIQPVSAIESPGQSPPREDLGLGEG